MSKSNFLKIKCPRCANEQFTFNKASSWVKCGKCNKLLIKPKGGKAQVKAPVREVIRDPLELEKQRVEAPTDQTLK